MELDKARTVAASSAVPSSRWPVPREIDLAVASRFDTRIICMIPSARQLHAFQKHSLLPGLCSRHCGLVTPGGTADRIAAHLQQAGAAAVVAIFGYRQL